MRLNFRKIWSSVSIVLPVSSRLAKKEKKNGKKKQNNNNNNNKQNKKEKRKGKKGHVTNSTHANSLADICVSSPPLPTQCHINGLLLHVLIFPCKFQRLFVLKDSFLTLSLFIRRRMNLLVNNYGWYMTNL